MNESSDATRHFSADQLSVKVFPSTDALAREAAREAAGVITEAIARAGEARVILATANSQVAFLDALAAGQEEKIDWSAVTFFHMDEYLGIPDSHPASFRFAMRQSVGARLKPRKFHYLEGDAEQPLDAIQAYTDLLLESPIDLCCLGIGENGHLAFNDPPVADFSDRRVVKIVCLDEACRRQQVGEGHFPDLDHVPQYALTLTIPALCAARRMIAIVPEARKANAVRDTLLGPVSEVCPASILRRQAHCTLYLDADSASLL